MQLLSCATRPLKSTFQDASQQAEWIFKLSEYCASDTTFDPRQWVALFDSYALGWKPQASIIGHAFDNLLAVLLLKTFKDSLPNSSIFEENALASWLENFPEPLAASILQCLLKQSWVERKTTQIKLSNTKVIDRILEKEWLDTYVKMTKRLKDSLVQGVDEVALRMDLEKFSNLSMDHAFEETTGLLLKYLIDQANGAPQLIVRSVTKAFKSESPLVKLYEAKTSNASDNIHSLCIENTSIELIEASVDFQTFIQEYPGGMVTLIAEGISRTFLNNCPQRDEVGNDSDDQRGYFTSENDLVSPLTIKAGIRQQLSDLRRRIPSLRLLINEPYITRSTRLINQLTGSCLLAADEQFLLYASQGYFAEADQFYVDSTEKYERTRVAACYQTRDYHVRLAELADLSDLMVLEHLCWPEGNRINEAILTRRIKQSPRHQLVLIHNKQLVGVIYSHRISHTQDVFRECFDEIDKITHPQGAVVQLQSLNIHPDFQHLGYGDQLLEIMLQYCSVIEGITTVVGVTRCKDYKKHRDHLLEDYIKLRNDQGRLVDSVLRFHELHGAQIQALVPNYRPADHDNDGYGVLVHYDLASRKRQPLKVNVDKKVNSSIEIKKVLTRAINLCIGREEKQSIDSEQSLMELGIDSADLLSLGESLGATLGLSLESTFFFKYSSFAAIVDELNVRLLPKAPLMQSETKSVEIDSQSVEVIIQQNMTSNQKPPSAAKTPRIIEKKSNPLCDKWSVVGLSGQFPGGDIENFNRGLDECQLHFKIETHNRELFDGINHISNAEYFDHAFFNISPAEADLMDPQQRLLLQHTYWAIENAGETLESIARKKTGVFIAAASKGYHESVELPKPSSFIMTSSSVCMYANRISHWFNLEGPSEYTNTACSSALVAIHRAIQSIQAGECEQAIVGSVNLIVSEQETLGYRYMDFLSQGKQTQSFQAAADGYVRAEGVGAILIKSAADADRDANPVYVNIIGSAVLHGGRGPALTAPNAKAMSDVLINAIRSAKLSADDIQYVEAHGTGSPMGDAIEMDALQTAFHQLKNKKTLYLGN